MKLFEYIDILNQPYDIFKTDSVHSPMHWHYYSEIIYMERGSVTARCNDSSTILNEGDLCYFYPLQLHEIADAGSDDVSYYVIKFDIHNINIPSGHLPRMFDYFVRRTSEDDFCLIVRGGEGKDDVLDGTVSRIVDEYDREDEFYMLGVQSLIQNLLIYIARNVDKEFKPVPKKHKDEEFSFFHILEYIDTHSSEPLEVQNLASMCHMSYSNFAKLFREQYGRSCKEYINYIRLNKAQEMLINSEYDLNYIAMETGFYDCSHFIRTYKKWKGITPEQERKRLSSS